MPRIKLKYFSWKTLAVIGAMHAFPALAKTPQDYFGPAVAPAFPVAQQQPCRNNNPQRNAYFGATHIHTTLSADANAFGVTSRPDDAYAFTRGYPLTLPPLDAQGKGTRVQPRPLPIVAMK